MSLENRRNTRRNSRRTRRTNNEDIFDSETLLIHEYIGLMSSIVRLNSNQNFEIQNNVHSMLRNLNNLFDNYYRWGRNERGNNNQNSTQNLDNNTTTNSRNTVNTNRNTEVVYNWGFNNPTSRTNSQSPLTAPTRTWSDIVSGNNRTQDTPTQNTSSRTTRTRPRSDRTLFDFNFTNNRPTNTNRIIRPSARTNNTFQTFLNSTLNTANFRGYTLNREQINQQTTTMRWREISESTDQTVCPINQTEFTEDEMISRINCCGHIFSTNAINNYLLNYDNRCPVCRVNLSTNTSGLSSSTNANSTNTIDTPSRTHASSTTNNSVEEPNQSNTSNLSESLSQEINNAVNIMSNAVVNEITNSIINTSTTPEQITAEYSLFLPNTTNTTTLTNATQPRTFSWTPNSGFTFQGENTNRTTNDNTHVNNTQTSESDASRYVTTYVESAFSSTVGNNDSTITENNSTENNSTENNSTEEHYESENREEKNEDHSLSNRK